MPNKATVRGVLMDATLAPISEGKIVATLSGSDMFDGAQIVTQKVEATTTPQGEWSIDLIVNGEGAGASTSWTIEGYNQYVAKVFEVKSLFLASDQPITLGDLEKTSAQNQKAVKEAGVARLVIAPDFSGYEALPFGQRRDSDLVLVDVQEAPLAIHAGLSGALFDDVQGIYVGGRSVPLMDARGNVVIAGQGDATLPVIVQPPALTPAAAQIGDSLLLSLGSAEGLPAPVVEWDITLNGDSIRDSVDIAAMRVLVTAPGEYALSVSWRNEAGLVAAATASVIVEAPVEVELDMGLAAGYFDASASYVGTQSAVTGLGNLGNGGWDLSATGSGADIAMGPDGIVFADGRLLQAQSLNATGIDGVFIVVRGVLDSYGAGVAQLLAANPSGGTIAIQNNNGNLQARYHDGVARNIALGTVVYGQEFVVGLEINNAAGTVRAMNLAGEMLSETPAGTPGVNYATVRSGQNLRGTINQIAVVTKPVGGSFALRFEDVLADFQAA